MDKGDPWLQNATGGVQSGVLIVLLFVGLPKCWLYAHVVHIYCIIMSDCICFANSNSVQLLMLVNSQFWRSAKQLSGFWLRDAGPTVKTN